jgi:hypothetical protein
MATPPPLKVQVEDISSKASTATKENADSSPDTDPGKEDKSRTEWEKMDSEYRKKWDSRMEASGYMTASSYLKVAVLIITWAPAFDDLKVAPEVG